MTNVRQSLFFIIVGTNGTGKTTLLNKLINETNRKSLILDPDGLEWKDVQEIEPSKSGELKSG
jgi:ABC-type cobalamin/Fe3+-siderophores transport system ATPase subunit